MDFLDDIFGLAKSLFTRLFKSKTVTVVYSTSDGSVLDSDVAAEQHRVINSGNCENDILVLKDVSKVYGSSSRMCIIFLCDLLY